MKIAQLLVVALPLLSFTDGLPIRSLEKRAYSIQDVLQQYMLSRSSYRIHISTDDPTKNKTNEYLIEHASEICDTSKRVERKLYYSIERIPNDQESEKYPYGQAHICSIYTLPIECDRLREMGAYGTEVDDLKQENDCPTTIEEWITRLQERAESTNVIEKTKTPYPEGYFAKWMNYTLSELMTKGEMENFGGPNEFQDWPAIRPEEIADDLGAEGKGILPEPPIKDKDGQPGQVVTVASTTTTTPCHTETKLPATPAPAPGTSTTLPAPNAPDTSDAPTVPETSDTPTTPAPPAEEEEPCDDEASTPAPVEEVPVDDSNTDEPCDKETPDAPAPTAPETAKEPCGYDDAAPEPPASAPAVPVEETVPEKPCDDEEVASPAPVDGSPVEGSEGAPIKGAPKTPEEPCEDESTTTPTPLDGALPAPETPEVQEPCDDEAQPVPAPDAPGAVTPTPSTPETPAPVEEEKDCEDEVEVPTPEITTSPVDQAPSKPSAPDVALPVDPKTPSTETPVAGTVPECNKRIKITVPMTCTALCASYNLTPKKFVELNPEVNDIYHRMYKAIKVATDGLRIRHGEEVHMDDDGTGTECEGVEIVEGGEYCVE